MLRLITLMLFGILGLKFHQAAEIGKNTKGDKDISDRIWNGTKVASIADIPYMALLYFTNSAGTQYQCGGSLISTRYVLTAGHCCNTKVSAQVVLGVTNRNSQGTRMSVKRKDWVLNKRFDPVFLKNDICLLRLPKDVPTDGEIKPITLVSRRSVNNDQFANQTAYIYGWGQRYNTDFTLPDDLQTTTNRVVTVSECKKQWSTVGKSQICTKKIDTGACPGDSGGPLILKSNGTDTLIGLVSFGGNCTNQENDAYTFVPAYRNWIKENSGV